MTDRSRLFPSILLAFRRTALAAVCTLAMYPMQAAEAQTFSVLHSFTGGGDGGAPTAGLTPSTSGSFYGTTTLGGNPGAGVVYRLSRSNGRWIVMPLFAFPGGYFGSEPAAPVIFGPNGTLFGTTAYGGYFGNGTVFNLGPPPTACSAALCGWDNNIIYRFQGGNDGATPLYGRLVFDQQGNLYGTTSGQFNPNVGTVYELTPVSGGWAETVLFRFNDFLNTGTQLYGGVIFDRAGNLYGTTYEGGAHQLGLVFQLAHSGSGWTENILYNFQGNNDGALPSGDLIFDPLGNLFGTTGGEPNHPGSVFELSPSQHGWTFTVVHTFGGPPNNGPQGGVIMDTAGNLYGATAGGAYGYGAIFKLTPEQNGTWTYTDLYDFFGATDGSSPEGTLTLDSQGNLFGTTSRGGEYGHGVIWEITP